MVFPAIADTDPPEKRAFEAALRRAFGRVVHAPRTLELRGRTGSASDALCDEIGVPPERHDGRGFFLADWLIVFYVPYCCDRLSMERALCGCRHGTSRVG